MRPQKKGTFKTGEVCEGEFYKLQLILSAVLHALIFYYVNLSFFTRTLIENYYETNFTKFFF